MCRHPSPKKQQTRLLSGLPQYKSRYAWMVMEFAAPSMQADVLLSELAATARNLCPTVQGHRFLRQQGRRNFPGKRNFSILIQPDTCFQLQTAK